MLDAAVETLRQIHAVKTAERTAFPRAPAERPPAGEAAGDLLHGLVQLQVNSLSALLRLQSRHVARARERLAGAALGGRADASDGDDTLSLDVPLGAQETSRRFLLEVEDSAPLVVTATRFTRASGAGLDWRLASTVEPAASGDGFVVSLTVHHPTVPPVGEVVRTSVLFVQDSQVVKTLRLTARVVAARR
jgi:hypothetical protein